MKKFSQEEFEAREVIKIKIALIDSLTKQITNKYYRDLKKEEKLFDKAMMKITPNQSQFLPVGTLPCEDRFLSRAKFLRFRYCIYMRALADMCSSLGLKPNKSLQRFCV